MRPDARSSIDDAILALETVRTFTAGAAGDREMRLRNGAAGQPSATVISGRRRRVFVT